MSQEQRFPAVTEFRICDCNPDVPSHGYFHSKKEGKGELVFPIGIPSVTVGRHLLELGDVQPEDEEHIERLQQEMRDAGLPEVCESQEEDKAYAEMKFRNLIIPPELRALTELLESAGVSAQVIAL